MTRNLEKKFLNIIKKNLLLKNDIKMTDNVKSFKKWDSLNNIRILIELNKSFNKNIKFGSIKDVKVLKDLFNYFI